MVESGDSMFIGEFNHKLDAKNRMALPAKFRDQLGDTVVITKGLDGCLTVGIAFLFILAFIQLIIDLIV